MAAVLRLLGCLLLTLAGGGTGMLLALRSKNAEGAVSAFTAFLGYLLSGIRYGALPAEKLIEAAARWPEFAPLELSVCHRLNQIQPPIGLGPHLCREATDCLRLLETAPTREESCTALERVLALCRDAAAARQAKSAQEIRLYPRLGLCLGLLAALFFL